MKKKYIVICLIILVIIGITVVWFLKKDKKSEFKEESIEYFSVIHGETFGVIDKGGNILLEPIYSNVVIPRHSKDVFFCYSDNINYKILNKEGKEVLKNFEEVSPIIGTLIEKYQYRDLLRYKENGKYGLIDTDGNRITRAIYDKIQALEDDTRTYKVVIDDKTGVLNFDGSILIKARYNDIVAKSSFNFSSNPKSVGYELKEVSTTDQKYGFASNTGKIILKPKFESIIRSDISDTDYYLIVQEKGRKGLYKNSKRLIDSEYQEIACAKTAIVVKQYNKFGMFSLEGRELISPRFDYYKMFGKYVTFVDGEKEYTYDGIGNQVAGSEYIIISDVPDKNYLIVSDRNSKMTLITDGRTLPDRYEDIRYVFDDYFIFQDSGKMGIFEVNKGVVLPAEYDYISKIYGTNIIKAHKGKEVTLYNRELYRIEFAKKFTEEFLFNSETLIIYTDKDVKYLDLDGHEVENVNVINRRYYAEKDGNKWGFIDKNGNTALKAKYDMVSEFNEYGFASVRVGQKWGVINESFEEIVKPHYEFKNRDTIPKFIFKYLIEENVKGLVIDINDAEITKLENR